MRIFLTVTCVTSSTAHFLVVIFRLLLTPYVLVLLLLCYYNLLKCNKNQQQSLFSLDTIKYIKYVHQTSFKSIVIKFDKKQHIQDFEKSKMYVKPFVGLHTLVAVSWCNKAKVIMVYLILLTWDGAWRYSFRFTVW